MDRRAFISSLAVGALAAPRPGPAQPARKLYSNSFAAGASRPRLL